MATTVTTTLRSSGGDYTSIATWESTEQADLVTADEVHVLECYDDWAGGHPNKLNLSGWTTDSTRYVEIRPATGEGHNGTPRATSGAGFYMKAFGNYGAVVIIDVDYTRFKGIEVQNTGSTSHRGIQRGVSSSNVWVDSCIVSDGAEGIAFMRSTDLITNCLAVDMTSYGFGENNNMNPTFANCVAANCGTGFQSNTSGTAQTLKNCVAYGCTTSYSGTANASSTNNAADDGATTTPPGSSPYTSNVVSGDFADAANDDYHLDSGSSLTTAGANLYSDFTTDIDGDTYPSSGSWPIGFDYVATTGTDITVSTGTVTITGTNASISQANNLSVGTGAVTITGTNAVIETTTTNEISVTTGAVTIAGANASIQQNNQLTVGTGSVTITGANVGVEVNRNVAVGTGSVTITGVNTVVDQQTAGQTNIIVGTGAVTVTGTNATINQITELALTTDSIVISGVNATVSNGAAISVGTGSLTIAGINAVIEGAQVVSCTTGAITIAGTDCTVTQEGLLWTDITYTPSTWTTI